MKQCSCKTEKKLQGTEGLGWQEKNQNISSNIKTNAIPTSYMTGKFVQLATEKEGTWILQAVTN